MAMRPPVPVPTLSRRAKLVLGAIAVLLVLFTVIGSLTNVYVDYLWFAEVGFTPSLSKVAALWSGKPTTVRLDDLDKICAALDCTVADLLEAEPVAVSEDHERQTDRAVGSADQPARPTFRRGRARRSLPPN